MGLPTIVVIACIIAVIVYVVYKVVNNDSSGNSSGTMASESASESDEDLNLKAYLSTIPEEIKSQYTEEELIRRAKMVISQLSEKELAEIRANYLANSK